MKNKVYLIGAGPGDPELITVKGLKLLQKADVVLYDALSSKELLQECKSTCLFQYVGKRAGQHYKSQDEINNILVNFAKNHLVVVRLKGGDPFVFGRGYEEIEYLRLYDIDAEVVPGISSALSLPLLQQVPLTHRGIADGFWVITGTKENKLLSEDIYKAINTSATLVVLMGIRKLPLIASILQRKGKGETPIMIIEKGSTPQEKVVISDANHIVELAKSNNVSTPGIIVIGEVVRYAKPEEFIRGLETHQLRINTKIDFRA